MYHHKIQYYETDRMGITHHSNYIRFMEEARTAWMEETGMSYADFEALGLTSPVISINCQYKHPTTYGDTLDIALKVIDCDHLKLRLAYEMRCRGELVATGESSHCFLDATGKPVSLKRAFPEIHARYRAWQDAQETRV